MEFCELPWDKKCLEYYKRKDLVSKTTSNIQIRKAIFKEAKDNKIKICFYLVSPSYKGKKTYLLQRMKFYWIFLKNLKHVLIKNEQGRNT